VSGEVSCTVAWDVVSGEVSCTVALDVVCLVKCRQYMCIWMP
jgi:hypothetical protein